MGMFYLSKTSKARLAGVHPELIRVIDRALEISPIDFTILEGLRTVERQRKLVAQGASKTMNSRHITGHAVDIAPYLDTDGDGDKEISWSWPHYHQLAKVIKQAAKDCGVTLTWGGDWRTFKDGPHWELDPRAYPFSKAITER